MQALFIMCYGVYPTGIFVYFRLIKKAVWCFIIDYGAFPTGILQYFELRVKGEILTFLQSNKFEFLWNDAVVIDYVLWSFSDWNFGVFSIVN